MRAMVMAAGRGTRLAPLTDVLPKPALPVGNEPVMGRLLRRLAAQGFREVVVNISYKADDMRRIFGDGSAFGVAITWSHEVELLGTAGGVKNAESFLRRDDDQPVVVLSGDGLHDADVVELMRRHTAAGAFATLGLTRVSDPSEYGVAILDEHGLITAFQEKPSRADALSDLANTGIYVLDPTVFDLIPDGAFHDFGNDVFPRLQREGRPMLGVELEGYWNDIGGLEAYRDSNLAVVDGRLDAGDGSAASDEDAASAGVLVHPTADVHAQASLVAPVVIGAGAVVEQGARVARSVVLPGARVAAGTMLAAATVGDVEGLAAWASSLAEHDVAPR